VTGLAPDDALRLAAAVERNSEHPVARAIVRSAEERSLGIGEARDVTYIPRRGVKAIVDGRSIAAGGPNLLADLKVEPEPPLREAAERAASKGQSTIYLVEGTRAIAAFAVADAIRPESREAVQRLHEQRIEVIMITGDAEPVARAVASELGIDDVLAQVLPEDKAKRVQELQAKGKKVAMVGDGVNDAPALTVADVGVAIGAGTQVAVEAGDVDLVRSDPRDLSRIVELSRASIARWCRTSGGRLATTSWPFHWPPGCWHRAGSCYRRRWGRCSCRPAPSSSRSTRSCCDAHDSNGIALAFQEDRMRIALGLAAALNA
jgi:Cu2+-exporting ATPase